MKSLIFLRAFLFLAFIGSCLSWGEEGHKIVAQIASDRLSSSGQKYVQQFLAGSQYSSLPDIAPLPDDYDHSPQGKWSAECHYCNLPRNATEFLMSYCPGCCVVKAITNYTNLLTNEISSVSPCQFGYGVEPCPLEFLVHFVGDIHQPLHVGYEDDEGGNTVHVEFFGKDCDLHSVWDTWIIEKWNNDYSSATSQLESIMQQNPSQVQQYISDMDVMDWADESFDFVMNTVYNFTTVNGVGQLDQTYYDTNLPIIQWRLIAAGVRLGELLNSIFDS